MVEGWQVSPHHRNPVTVGQGGLQCAIDSLGADRLLFGTDLPYENGASPYG